MAIDQKQTPIDEFRFTDAKLPQMDLILRNVAAARDIMVFAMGYHQKLVSTEDRNGSFLTIPREDLYRLGRWIRKLEADEAMKEL